MPTEIMKVADERAITPMTLIEKASAQGASIEQMAQLFDLKLRVDADEAKRAFNEAFTAFKNEPIRVIKDKENSQFSKAKTNDMPAKKAMYASIENYVETVTPFLSKHGLTASWGTPAQTPSSMTVSCTLTHTMGHSKTETVTGPLDTSGAKNALQQIKSTATYLKIMTFESVCGLASVYGNLSDDGNGGAGAKTPAPPTMTDEDYQHYIEQIASAGTRNELKSIYEAGYKIADDLGDAQARSGLIAAKDRRKAQL